MSPKRKETGSVQDGKKASRRIRVKFGASRSSGTRRVSLLARNRAPLRTRVTLRSKKLARARRR
jgi:hypothetical protein